MKKFTLFGLCLFITVNIFATSETPPEKVYPITRVQKSLDFYQQQVVAWKKVLSEKPQQPDAWLNYYSAARCARILGEEPTPGLDEIVEQMKAKLSDQHFEYHYILAWNTGIWKDSYFDHLKEAYRIAPDRSEIYHSFLAYYLMQGKEEKVEEFSKKWLDSSEYSPGILTWNYNALMSVEENGILLTYGDNDTYPAWMLQYGKGIRQDVAVINLHLLNLPDYRKQVFAQLQLPEMKTVSSDPQQLFSEAIAHINTHSNRSLYLGIAINHELREAYHEQLYVTGLALKYQEEKFDNLALLKDHYEHKFLTDYLKVDLAQDISQSVLDQMNLNYIPPFMLLYRHYEENGQMEEVALLKEMVKTIAVKGGRGADVEKYFP